MTALDDLLLGHLERQPDVLAVADAPNRGELLAGEPRRLSWVELDGEVASTAAMLGTAGVGRGTAVAVQLPNTVELVTTLLACFRLGAIAVPFPIQHREHELRSGLAVAGVEVLVTAERFDRPDQLDIVGRAIESSGREVRLIDIARPPAEAGSTVKPTQAPDPNVPDTPTTICWTSGTTGTPKGVPRTAAMWLASGRFQVDQLELNTDDRILCPFPLVNMAGIGGILVPWLISGGELHLHQPLNLAVFLQQVATERITYTVAPPAILNMLLLRDGDIDESTFSSVRKIASGAAPLDPWMVEGWEERGIEIVNVFGSNEGAALLSTADAVPDPAQRAQCFPEPDPARVQIRLVDLETGDDVAEPGVLGELRFRGPTVFEGYLGSSGEEFDEQGFYRTGDLFQWADIDADPRLLKFVDRVKDIVIRGGMNISASEVEALIVAGGLLSECAVIGYPDPELGERVGVIGAPGEQPGPTLGQIVAQLQELGVASYKLPERLELVDELPKNPLGKVVKTDLRARWAEVASG